MSSSLNVLSQDERIRYGYLHLHRDTLSDDEYSEYINFLNRIQVKKGGSRRSKQSKKRSATRRRRSSNNKSRKTNKRRM